MNFLKKVLHAYSELFHVSTYIFHLLYLEKNILLKVIDPNVYLEIIKKKSDSLDSEQNLQFD